MNSSDQSIVHDRSRLSMRERKKNEVWSSNGRTERKNLQGRNSQARLRNAGERSVGKYALETLGRGLASASNKY